MEMEVSRHMMGRPYILKIIIHLSNKSTTTILKDPEDLNISNKAVMVNNNQAVIMVNNNQAVIMVNPTTNNNSTISHRNKINTIVNTIMLSSLCILKIRPTTLNISHRLQLHIKPLNMKRLLIQKLLKLIPNQQKLEQLAQPNQALALLLVKQHLLAELKLLPNRPNRPKPTELKLLLNRPNRPKPVELKLQSQPPKFHPHRQKKAEDLLNQPKQAEDLLSRPKQVEDLLNRQKQAEDLLSRPKQAEDLLNQPKQVEDLLNRQKQAEDLLSRPKQVGDLLNRQKQAEDLPNRPKNRLEELAVFHLKLMLLLIHLKNLAELDAKTFLVMNKSVPAIQIPCLWPSTVQSLPLEKLEQI